MKRSGFTPLMKNGTPPVSIPNMSMPASLVEVIGMGAFGIVLRAEDSMGVQRAFKVFLPPKAILGLGAYIPPTMDASTDFTEITLTNRHPFKHVIAVAYHGDTVGAAPSPDIPDTFYKTRTAYSINENEPLPFTVSPLVDGINLEDFFKSIDSASHLAIRSDQVATAALHDHVLTILRHSVAGLVELREANVIHMDIKASNIMVHAPGSPFRPLSRPNTAVDFRDALRIPAVRWEAFVTDLGIARSVPPGRHGLIPLVMTLVSLPQSLLWLLEEDTERKGFVQIDRLREYGASIDLSMFGAVMWAQFMDRAELNPRGQYLPSFREQESEKVAFWKHVFRDDYDVITGMARELVKSDVKRWANPAEFLRRLQTIPLFSDNDIYASSILTDRHPEIKIRTGKLLVRLGHPMHEIVDHPQFQRLRNMAQLAFVSNVFPEATHTRFSHSLRTYELAKEAVRFLTPKSMFRLIFTRRDVDHLLAAALLHDIGQYPFAHTIEDLRDLGDHVAEPHLQCILHDHELVDRVISAEDRRDRRGRTIRDILAVNGFNVEDILYVIHKQSDQSTTPALRVSHDLIAKVVDLDRVAYLLQDSERSGVPYGSAIDVESLLDGLTIAGSYDDFARAPYKLQLAIDEGGVSAAEAVLAAVYWMYRNVYWRHTNRAFMAMIKVVAKYLFVKAGMSFDQYWQDMYDKSEMEALQYLSDKFDTYKESGSVNPLIGLLHFERLGYSRVKTIHPLHRASRVVHKRLRSSLAVDAEENLAIAVENYLRGLGLKVARGMVLADIGFKGHLPQAITLPVITERHLTRRLRDESRDLLAYSRLASRLTRIERSESSRIRIFFSRELTESMSQAQQAEVEDGLLQHLESVLPT